MVGKHYAQVADQIHGITTFTFLPTFCVKFSMLLTGTLHGALANVANVHIYTYLIETCTRKHNVSCTLHQLCIVLAQHLL